MKIKCPRCQQETEYAETNKYRPFCSERCQMIDLGAWAEGNYAIPVTDPAAIEELLEQSPELTVEIGSETEPDESLH